MRPPTTSACAPSNISSRSGQIALTPSTARSVRRATGARFELVQTALRSEPRAKAVRLAPAERLVPSDTLEHAQWILDDPYLFQLHSQVLESLGVPEAGPPIPWPRKPVPGSSAEPPGVRRRLKCALAALAPAQGAALHDLDLSTAQASSLFARLAGTAAPAAPAISAAPPAAADARLRAGLGEWPGRSDFERAAGRWLPQDLPRRFVEGYARLKESASSWKPRRPAVIISANGWTYQESFKAWAAACAEEKARLVAVQHGGGYGMYGRIWQEWLERRSADAYWTWGWAGLEDDSRARNAPSPSLSRLPRRRGGGDALLVATDQPRFRYGFQSQALCGQFPAYLEARERFLAALPPPMRERLVVRLMSPGFGWGQAERMAARDLGVRQEDMSRPLAERLAQARLVIIDHPASSLLEALASGAPLLLFWDPAVWDFRPSAWRMLERLEAAGVYFRDPEQASRAAADLWPDPEAWWRSDRVRPAVEEFRRAFALASGAFAAEWAQAVRREVDEA
ncbi:MAG: LIC12162 family protein [Elusimicrobia bacterium]|nr:LIC12162 family protein [Elusimicrobiota bacterium]